MGQASHPAALEKPPPPGDRIRKLELIGCELLAREERLTVFWTKQLQSELCASDAPVLQKLEDSLDPARALEMLAGKTRAGALKISVGDSGYRRLSCYTHRAGRWT